MSTGDYPEGTKNDPNAPWNDNYPFCEECEVHMEWITGGDKWNEYKCPVCGHVISDEPDWDSMSGGKDDY